MTRKDFSLIASTLKASSAPDSVCLAMAVALSATNPNFNRMMFLTACGVK